MKSKRETVLLDPDEGTREMALPEGENCGNCVSFPRCKALIGVEAENEVCDFYPNRFLSNSSLFMRG